MSLTSTQPRLLTAAARALRRPDVIVVGLATTYVSIATVDVKLAGVPLKLYVVAIALATWLFSSRPWSTPRPAFRFAIPVVLASVVVPCVWFLVAAWLSHRHDPAQRHGLSDAVQEASRFGYLLLYFPLADRRWLGDGWDRLWRWPALVLCGVTIGLFVGHLLGAGYGGSGTVGPFQGAVAVDATGTFRAFLVNDVLFLPLLCFLIARRPGDPLEASRVGSLALLLFALFLAHTRGLWLGACAVVLIAGVAMLPTDRLAAIRRGARVLVIVACIGVLAASADPNLARSAVRLVTARHEYSTAERLAQAPQLLTGFKRHPVLGSGLGATLPSGFTRDPSMPWSFELTYLQLLFQVGVLGLVVVLAPALIGLSRAAFGLRNARFQERPLGFAMLAGLAALLITAAGNPYLLTSVGTYALAVFLATLDREMSGNEAPARPRAGRLPGGGRVAGVIYAGTTACVVALAVLEFARPHQAVPGSGPAPPGFTTLAPGVAAQTMSLTPAAKRLLSDPLAIDAGAGGPQTIWAFSSSSGTVRAIPISLVGRRALLGRPLALGKPLRGARVTYAVSRWGASRTQAAFELVRRRSAIAIDAVTLSGPARVILTARTPAIAARAGSHRDLAIVRTGARRPDLIVVDRDRTKVLRVHVYSGASRFRRQTLDASVSLASSFSPTSWSVSVGALQTRGADLVLTGSDSRKPGAQVEAHVLLGNSKYRAFGAQTKLGLPLSSLHSLRFLIGHGNEPTLYSINVHDGTIEKLLLR
jgi:hypothetical protein